MNRPPVRFRNTAFFSCLTLIFILAGISVLCCTSVSGAEEPAVPAAPAVTVTPAITPPAEIPGEYPGATGMFRGFYSGFRQGMVSDSFIVLLQLMGIIVLVAYLLTRSRIFPEILDGHPSLKTQVILILLFGALSIYGTLSGIEFHGSYINIRDLGPMAAGILAGPYVGVAAGLIGAAYRLTLGGFTVYACSAAAVFAGLFGGIVWLWKKKRFCGITAAVLLAVVTELFHMALILLMSRPYEMALEVVDGVVFPMILANAAGILIFAFMVQNYENERVMQAQRDTLLKEMEHKNTELTIAAEIQQDFLPSALPQTEGFMIAAKSIAAKEVGGDFFDVIPSATPSGMDAKTGIVIADVSGKGIPAALFMAFSQTVVRVLSTSNDQPARLMEEANALIALRSQSGMFVTLFFGILYPQARTLTFINAGHNPPLLFRAGSGKAPDELFPTGPALGIAPESRYRQYTVPLAYGDTLVLYTDGITEAMNHAGEMFGTERVAALVREKISESPQDIMDAVIAGVLAFAGAGPQYDDITIIVVRVA